MIVGGVLDDASGGDPEHGLCAVNFIGVEIFTGGDVIGGREGGGECCRRRIDLGLLAAGNRSDVVGVASLPPHEQIDHSLIRIEERYLNHR